MDEEKPNKKEDSITLYLKEGGNELFDRNKETWEKEIFSEPLKPRRLVIVLLSLATLPFLFVMSASVIAIYLIIKELTIEDDILTRIAFVSSLIIFFGFFYVGYIAISGMLYSNLKKDNGLVMKIFKKGVYLKTGYYYKSPTKEVSIEMLFPFEELKIVPIFSQWATSNENNQPIKMWQLWHKKYDFFGKLSPYSGNRLISGLRNILSPDELEKIVKDYELILGLEENGV